MNFPKERQADLLKLAVITGVVLFGLWFVIGRPTQSDLAGKARAISDLNQKIASKKNVIQQAEQIKAEVRQRRATLKEVEDQMVVGDPYLWILRILRDFEIPKQLEFTRYDPPQMVTSIFPPKLPYQTASFVVVGTSTYHDFGNFLANLENSYQHIRVHRIDMEPVVSKTDADEKLSFLMELHVLVKPEIKTPTTVPRS